MASDGGVSALAADIELVPMEYLIFVFAAGRDAHSMVLFLPF